MKKILFIFFFVVTLILKSQSISDVRESYRTAIETKDNAIKFYKKLEKTENNKTILEAYKGASYIVLARFEPLLKKKSKIKVGKELIENYINENPTDIEARFIRLTLQKNLPKVAKYNTNIQEDEQFIKENKKTIKDQQIIKMLEFLD